MAYNAHVTRLTNVTPHSNANLVQLATCDGNQVVIGLDHAEGELGVYFPTDGQISPQDDRNYKFKSYEFKVFEGIIKDSGVVDNEEAQG
jgi:hypothetical protein